MSYTFYVSNLPEQTPAQIFGLLNDPSLQTDATDLDGPWPEFIYVHQDGVSTRAIEAAFEQGRFSARIFSGASPEDYELGLSLVRAVAEQHKAAIESEEGLSLELAEFGATYGSDWVGLRIQPGRPARR